MTDLSVIVVAFHNADLLQRCLSSLPRELPVWVIDNSADPEVEAVAVQHGATYVDTGSNLGFAGGVNIGLRAVPSDSDVLLLNPDAVISEASLRALHSHLRAPGHERLAAVSPALLDPRDGSRQRVRWPLPTPGRMWREAIGLSRLAPPPDEYSIGAVLMLRAEAIADVGFFDQRFFLYAEEADWQRRALDRGWHTAEVPSVSAEHIGAGTSPDSGQREMYFHAGQETFIRKWNGALGWLAYRTAASSGAAVRALLSSGRARARASARARLYLRGPRSLARLSGGSEVGRRITHVVVTDAFAGVERYVCDVAREQAHRGSIVTVIGGHPDRMQAELAGAHHRPAGNLREAALQLRRLGGQDIVHAHMTSAELVAVITRPWHKAHIVSTRHFARPRGSSPAARALGHLLSRGIDQQIAISHFVGRSIDDPTIVVPNGVACRPNSTDPRDRTVLCLQRLEAEKATDLALRAWAESGVWNDGWELLIAGAGSLRPELEQLSRDLHIAESVRWLGHLTDTAAQLKRAGLLLATATAEPFGLSVAEAMAWATPVLASDGGAHLELLGEDGWTFPSGSVADAARLLRRLTTISAEARRKYGEALRDRQRELYSLGRHVSELNLIYERRQYE